MSRFSDQVRDEYGRTVPGVSVYVYKWDADAQVAGDLETLTDDLSAPLANPLTSDADGLYYFNSADGQKLLELHYGGKAQMTELILVGALPVPQAAFGGLFANAAALTIPVGMDMIGTTGYSALGVGGANYIYDAAVDAAYVAAHPRASFISANSRGFRLDLSDGLSIDQLGSLADCTSPGVGTANAAAINAAIAYAALNKGSEILIPRNNLGYRVESALVFTGGIKLRGQGFSQSPVATYPTAPQHIKGSMLVFDANVAGLKFLAYTDHAANDQVVQYESAVYSVLEDFVLFGGGGTSVTAHGLETRTVLHCRNVWVQNFAGENLRVDASTGGTNNYGNANGSKFDHCLLTGAGCHGAHLRGSDANGIKFDTCVITNNGGLGVLDETGIGGNSYDDCIFELNNTSWGATSTQRTQVLADFAGLSDRAFGSIAFTSTNVAHSCRHCYNELAGWGMKAHLPIGVMVEGGLLSDPACWDATSGPCGTNASNGTYYMGALKAVAPGTTLSVGPQLVWNADLGWSGVSSDARINYSAGGGLMMGGQGTAQDLTVFNKDALSVFYINTGSRSVNFQADLILNSATGKITINGTQVLTAQRTGWTAATGTPARGAFAAAAAGTVSAAYVQAEAQASRDRIAALEARFIALEADARTHGLIN